MKTIQRYACSICDTVYNSANDAQVCESRGLDPLVAIVGDIVFVKAGFRWFDGNVVWVSNHQALGGHPGDLVLGRHATRPDRTRQPDHGNCFGACCTYQFYYVVTAIDVDERDKHRRRYHVMTKAMANAGYGGWTFAQHHYTPKVVERPPVDVIADSKDLLGRLAGHLL